MGMTCVVGPLNGVPRMLMLKFGWSLILKPETQVTSTF